MACMDTARLRSARLNACRASSLVDWAYAAWLEEMVIGYMYERWGDGFLYVDELVLCPHGPGSAETDDFYVFLEPGCGAAFACDGSGSVTDAPNQTSATCIR
nr:unnamed protein product [Digitaria exilis]